MNAALKIIPFDQDPLGGMRPRGQGGSFLPPANDNDDWQGGDGADYDDDGDMSYCHVVKLPAAKKPLETECTPNVERALTLARLGMSVFPCRSQDEIDPQTGEVLKKAKSPLTPHGLTDASTEPGAIVSWWTRWPDALVGLPTGRENGIAVVDLDEKNGTDWHFTLPSTGLDLPDTHTVETRSGGEHRYYRYPENVEKIKSTTNLFRHLVGIDKTGIDVRGDGGYVIAWGDLTREIIAGLAEWPTEAFADAKLRDQKAGRPQPPQTTQPPQHQPDDLGRAIEALKFVPADDRDDWVKVGMALKAAFGESGRDAWDAWSQTSDKYDARDQEAKWRSFNGSGIGLGTLFELAKRHGYKPPASGAGFGTTATDDKNRAKLPNGYRYKGATIEYYDGEDEDGNPIWRFLCSAVEFRAVTRNPEGKDWGLALRIRTPDGKWNSLTVTQAMTMDQRVFFSALYDCGLVILPGDRSRFLTLIVCATFSTAARVCCVPHVGWHELADGSAFFALPDQTFGAPAGEEIVYQPQWNERPLYRLKGTLEGWQKDVARYAVKNSRLAFALASGFAGPLLYLMSEEGGGVHFYGLSSMGKTRLLKARASIWTGGGITGGIGTWRGTDNGTEGKAWAHNDTSMDLDEIGQVKPEVAYQAAYMLSNGQGKTRMSANAVLRQSYEWRVFFASTGETPIGDKIAENGGKPMAGQAVRVLDIPADAGAGMGVFEELHGFKNSAQLADAFRGIKNYGHAARAYLQSLADDPEQARQRVENYMRAFEKDNCPAGADGQVKRVLRRFALIAAAGQLATDFGILPWPEGESARAAKKCFEVWLGGRGSAGPLETLNALSHIRSMIELHGSSRFQDCAGYKSTSGRYVINQLGYADQNTNIFYFSTETFRKEVCKGFDHQQVLRALREVGALDHEAGRYTKNVRLSENKGPQRFYVINANILLGIDEK